ncbi:MAG: Cof-type HAD-IIB family hydrolase, partial [Lachnospiraceae bacterium]
TLMNSNNQISEENKKWIQVAREKGVYILLISGRPYVSMERVAKELGLDDCIVVALAGCDIRKYPSGTSVSSSCLTKEQVLDLQKLATDISCYLQVFRLDGSYYFQKKTKYSDMYEAYFGYSGQQLDMQEIAFCDICKGMFIMEPEDLKKAEKQIGEGLPEGLNAETIWKNMIDTYRSCADKGTGVKYVANLLGISNKEIIACGDEKVDLPMFKEVGLSVAMGNAVEEVKKAVDIVTLTNDEDGVAEIIKRYIV